MAVNSKKMPVRRWLHGLNGAMPVALDTAGIILLSGSAMMWDQIAGVAAAGIGCFFLNWRWYGDK